MKFKLKTYIGSILMGSITIYSGLHPEKYHIAIPILFGILTCLSIGLLLTYEQIQN